MANETPIRPQLVAAMTAILDVMSASMTAIVRRLGPFVSIAAVIVALVAVTASVIGIFRGDSGAEVSADQVFWDSDEDQLIDCLFVVDPTLTTPYCEDPGLLAGRSLATFDADGGQYGFDVDEDGQLELVCDRTLISTPVDQDQRFQSASCVPVDDSGPSSDRFLLTDGTTSVERIDITGNGRADFVVIGDAEPIALSQPLPWYRAILPGVLIAMVGGFFSVVVVWLTQRTSDESS